MDVHTQLDHHQLSHDVDTIRQKFAHHLKYSMAKDRYTATDWDRYLALSITIRDYLIDRWMLTHQTYHRENVKRIYYLSLEYLMGRSLVNNIVNLKLNHVCAEALSEFDLDWEKLSQLGVDAGLGNGGLGRLAACVLDSIATLGLPAVGYGLRYDYGIFRQEIEDGYQVEEPDEWLRYGNPWEIERPEYQFPVSFGGAVEERHENGTVAYIWIPAYHVLAIPFDTPIVGYDSDNVNTLRLWSAKASEEFDLGDFNEGDYMQAVAHKVQAENLTKVLYPSDSSLTGKELRFRQQYFFVSATIQDIVRRFKLHNADFHSFPDKVAIQLNDTHPTLAIPELMHNLIDKEHLPWDMAWDLTVRTFGYTNHTLLPEALEEWPVHFFETYLPRHIQIIYEINSRFLEQVSFRHPGDNNLLARMSIIAEGDTRRVRMAYLGVVGSHSINGVAKLHTRLIKERLLKDFYEFFPGRFNNKTNGVTPRRWLLKANPLLAEWITDRIGTNWISELERLRELEEFLPDTECLDQLREIKLQNKRTLAEIIEREHGIKVNAEAIFDVHIKRFHEYKRQLLNVLHIIMLYRRLKANPGLSMVPRVFIFSGKAAPGYYMAKLTIKLIHCVAEVVNNDKTINDLIKVVFFPNYSVSLAEQIIPASDISEQISTAGMEASGTGNMKMALNGALTLGTLDGANIEIKEEVGDDNIFIFGLTAEEIAESRNNKSYDPVSYYENDPEIKQTLDLLFENFFSLHDPQLFEPLRKYFFDYGDYYYVLADFRSYADRHHDVELAYQSPNDWAGKALLNIARTGKFSSDRMVREYTTEIWNASPKKIDISRRNTDTIVAARSALSGQQINGY